MPGGSRELRCRRILHRADTQCPEDTFLDDETECRPAGTECNVAELCTGTDAFCPADGFVEEGTPCTDDDNACTLDQCDGAGQCTHPVDPEIPECAPPLVPLVLVRTIPAPSAQAHGFGFSIAAAGDKVLVGAPYRVSGEHTRGAAYLFDPAGGTLLHTYENPVTAEADDQFGFAVAGGAEALIGDPSASIDSLSGAGVVHRFSVEDGALAATYVPPTPVAAGGFGSGLAVTDNGDVLAATRLIPEAYRLDAASGEAVAAYSNPSEEALRFPYAVASTGTLVVLGNYDGGDYLNVFDADAGDFERSIATPSEADLGFGASVATAGEDGIVVGAPLRLAGGYEHGIAYLFNPADGSVMHTFVNPSAEEEDDHFGAAVAGLPYQVLVSAPLATVDEVTAAGVVYSFAFADGTLVDSISPEDAVAGGMFGASLTLTDAHSRFTGVRYSSPAAGIYRPTYPLPFVVRYPNPESATIGFPFAVAALGDKLAVGNFDGGTFINLFGDGSTWIGSEWLPVLRDTIVAPDLHAPYGYALGTAGEHFVATWFSSTASEGAAYLIHPNTGSILQTYPNPSTTAGFGSAVAGPGPLVAVAGLSDTGVVQVFNASSAQFLQTLSNPNQAIAGFGYALAAIGNSLIVSAYDATGGNPGAVYVYAPCGDATLDPGEQCDDGNREDNDGCSATCQLEAPEGCAFRFLAAAEQWGTAAGTFYDPPNNPEPLGPACYALLDDGVNVVASLRGPLGEGEIEGAITALLRWPTELLPHEQSVAAAWLQIGVGGVDNADDKSLEADWHDWGPACDGEDHDPNATATALSVPLSAITPGLQTFELAYDVGDIVLGGSSSTYLRLHVNAESLTGVNGVALAYWPEVAARPRLVVLLCEGEQFGARSEESGPGVPAPVGSRSVGPGQSVADIESAVVEKLWSLRDED